MENISNKLSVEELVRSYNSKQISKVNITIYIGSDRVFYNRIGAASRRYNESIVFDPDRVLAVGDYVGAYYCNSLKDLEQIVDYLVNESLQYNTESEDVLDQATTKRFFYNDLAEAY